MDPVTQKLPIIDAHQHFWDTTVNYYPWLCDKPRVPFRYGDYEPICRPYLPPEYLADAGRYQVAGTVYIEAEWDPRNPLAEMSYIEKLRKETAYPTVAVGQAQLDSIAVQPILEQLANFDFVRGIRQKPRANSTPNDSTRGQMTEATWRSGFSLLARYGLRFDLQTPWWHLHEAVDLARLFPDTSIILNHTGLPSDRSSDGLNAWHSAMMGLAQCPNVTVKISGLGTPGIPWSASANRWIVLSVIDIFGCDRCMFASNFPVDSLCGSFDDIFGGFHEIVSDFSPNEQQQLFLINAARIYAIAP